LGTENTPVVEMRGIIKNFGPVQALRGVSFQLYPSEVLGLVGDNGAGKSTLMKVLTGVHQPDGGEILMNGAVVHFPTPQMSRSCGIEMVYQDLALSGNLSVTENIYLGQEPTHSVIGGLLKLVDHKGMASGARELLDRLHIEIRSVFFPVEKLSGGQRQAVAIGRAAGFAAKVVIMDEPTAALAVKEVTKVLDLINTLRQHNVAVILISHRMQDVFAACDRILVLRQGQIVGNVKKSETSMDEIVSLITGAKESSLAQPVEVG
jgi:simple sugar transport system ATP-binding protein